jgi:glycosyltransferase involved in cell wall biosynthesis
MGITVFLTSVIMIVYFIFRYFSGHTISGWPSMICSLWGIGGLVLFSIGIVGEYIGKIYLETKRRPRFQIEKILYQGDNYENT